ncbi:hypothetical protein OG892_19170 [Streptomyces sp. NBC_00341]|uniref:hypothetical protein n=1 Tax=Streptomyces sp. NBC_00341 TaxID=2975717 RepID=UPI00308D9C4C|nr:hypothetical protein OG892_19170 [Streptomyces sp. NBC_00341]
MSTTTTGSDSEEPRRLRSRIAGPLRARATRRGAERRAPEPTGSVRLPMVMTDGQQRRLLRTARRHGAKEAAGRGVPVVPGRTARPGVFDPWVLNSKGRAPYFAELAAVRDMLQGRLTEQAAEVEKAASVEDSRAKSEVDAAETELRLRDDLVREADEQVRASWSQLNRLAARAVRWELFRDRVREQVEVSWLQARFRDSAPADDEDEARHPDGAPPGAGPGANPVPEDEREPAPDEGFAEEGWQSLDPEGHTAGTQPSTAPPHVRGTGPERQLVGGVVPPPDPGWEGMPARPGMPSWMTWGVLLAIAAVEIPIYWIAYQPFHGTGSTGSDFLSGTLAISTAVLMVLLPHLAGRTLRGRQATGSVKAAALPALALLGVWGFAGWALGDLRARLVLQHPDPVDVPSDLGDFSGAEDLTAQTLADRLHLLPQTITWMFVSLLFLSGGIGFLLGLLREHPFLDAYRAALERRSDRVRQREEARAAVDHARSLAETAQDRAEQRWQAVEARSRALDSLYEAAANAFLDGLMARSRDPAVTEAAMRHSARWPLLPPRPEPPARRGA